MVLWIWKARKFPPLLWHTINQFLNYQLYQSFNWKDGFAKTIECDGDQVQSNEGGIRKVYVNDQPKPSATDGMTLGRYVIIEVNTDYMLNGQNLTYTASMMAGVKQVGMLLSTTGEISPSSREVGNYTVRS